MRFVRKYKLEWLPDDKGNEFNVSETIYEFSSIGVTRKARAKAIKGWKDYKINEIGFEESRLLGQEEYNEFKEELKELPLKEKLGE